MHSQDDPDKKKDTPEKVQVCDCPQHKEILPAWRSAHKGLGGSWRAMDKVIIAKYVAISKQMKGPYDHQIKLYRKQRQELMKSIKTFRISKRAAAQQKKMQRIQAKKAKAAHKKAKKALKRKGEKSRKYKMFKEE